MKLLITEPLGFHEESLKKLQNFFHVDFGSFSRNELKEIIHLYDGIIIRLYHYLDKELLFFAKNLKFIASPTTGLNHIDLFVAKKLNIEILSLKNEAEFLEDIHATAEHTWALLMAIIRKIPLAYRSVIEGNWNRDDFISNELNGKTLGIIGYGRIGKKIFKFAKCFGMNVIVNDIASTHLSQKETSGLINLFKKSDIVILSTSYSDKYIKFINKKHFHASKKPFIFINTSRGELVNEDDLISGLEDGIIAAAALDVVKNENQLLKDKNSSKIIQYAKHNDNVLITPHIGGATEESMRKTEKFITEKVLDFAIKYKQNNYQK